MSSTGWARPIKYPYLNSYDGKYIILFAEFSASGRSTVGSALGSGPRGRGFDSRRSDHFALVAQLDRALPS